MQDWFKARNIWGAAIMALSDAEAGRLMKALWYFTMTGEKQTLSGAEKGIFALILMTLSQDEANNAELSKKRSLAGTIGGKQRAANQANACFAIENEANQANACNKSKNKETETEKEKDIFIDDDDAREIQTEQDRVLDAAEDAGFIKSNSVRARLIRLYAEHGLEKMLAGISSCVTHGAVNLAYLEAVLRGEPRKEKPKVVAQDFQQRDYSDVPGDMMNSLAAEIAAFKAQKEASG